MTEARMRIFVREFDSLFESLVGGTPEDRAAIWGQGEQESNANPAAEEQPNSDRYGIGFWQHSFDRHTGLVDYAEKVTGKPWSDMETQVRFVAQELNGPYAHVWSQIKDVATTLQSKTETAMALFEGPAHWREEIKNPGTTSAGLPRRLKGAEWALSEIKSKGPIMTDTQTQLAGLEQNLETAANALVTKQFPQFAPLVSTLEKALVEPLLPAINAKLGVTIDSNQAAHAVFELLVLGVGYGLSFLLPKIVGATK